MKDRSFTITGQLKISENRCSYYNSKFMMAADPQKIFLFKMFISKKKSS